MFKSVLAKAKQSSQNEDGMIMIEALIVYLFTAIILFLLLVLMFLVFQVWSCQIVANETAARIGQTYSFKDANLETGKISLSDITDRKLYRGTSGYLDSAASERSKTFSTSRLGQLTFVDFYRRDVETSIETDYIARQHIVVRLKGDFFVPFGSIVKTNRNGIFSYDVKGVSPCFDVSDYMITTDALYGLFHTDVGSSLTSLINSLLSLIEKII